MDWYMAVGYFQAPMVPLSHAVVAGGWRAPRCRRRHYRRPLGVEDALYRTPFGMYDVV